MDPKLIRPKIVYDQGGMTEQEQRSTLILSIVVGSLALAASAAAIWVTWFMK